MKICAIQINVADDKAQNLSVALDMIELAVAEEKPDLLILPEMSAFMSADAALMRDNAEPVDGPFLKAVSDAARRLGVYIHSGSIVELRGERRFNTSFLFDRDGELVGQYSKLHRFSVTLPNGFSVSEADMVDRGNDIVVVEIEGVKLGFAICYDLRFGELFQQLVDAGANVIAVPSAFTFQTGSDHWEVLLRARAIETQCYVVAPGQWGGHDGGKGQSWGHSMIVDPWGLVVSQASNRNGYAVAKVDLGYLGEVRSRLPLQSHRVLLSGGDRREAASR